MKKYGEKSEVPELTETNFTRRPKGFFSRHADYVPYRVVRLAFFPSRLIHNDVLYGYYDLAMVRHNNVKMYIFYIESFHRDSNGVMTLKRA